MARNEWEVRRGGAREYVQILPDAIVYGRDIGNRFYDDASQCTHAEFLAGCLHDGIRQDFGSKALAEMIAEVEQRADAQ